MCVDLLVQRIFSDFCIYDEFWAFHTIEDEHANTDFKNLQGGKKSWVVTGNLFFFVPVYKWNWWIFIPITILLYIAISCASFIYIVWLHCAQIVHPQHFSLILSCLLLISDSKNIEDGLGLNMSWSRKWGLELAFNSEIKEILKKSIL